MLLFVAFVDFIKVKYPDVCILNSLYSDGNTETDLFCECLENVVNDCALTPRQTDPLNILEPLKQVVAIDNGELVSTYMYSPFFIWLLVARKGTKKFKACVVVT